MFSGYPISVLLGRSKDAECGERGSWFVRENTCVAARVKHQVGKQVEMCTMEADRKCLGRSCGKYALLMAFGRDMSSLLECCADTDARCEGGVKARRVLRRHRILKLVGI